MQQVPSSAETVAHLPEGPLKDAVVELHRQLWELQLIVARSHPEAIPDNLRQSFGLGPSSVAPKKSTRKKAG
jgi:hypothetical protein